MIKSLSINNYALIEKLEMSPSSKLNIITGETGAGKSIMLGAVGLLLGNRADSRSLFSEKEKCFIEGVFDISDYQLETLFESFGLDHESECIIRREIGPSGKSRAFVNDTPVTLDTLKKISARLIDIHSQHESLELGDSKYQQEILDLFAQNKPIFQKYADAYKTWQLTKRKVASLEEKASRGLQDSEYKKFLLNELQKAELRPKELEELEEELSKLENAEEIKINLGRFGKALSESDFSIVNQIKEALSLISSVKSYDKALEDIYERLSSVSIEVEDLASFAQKEQETVELDPERLQVVKERVDLILRLQQKHQVGTTDDLLGIQEKLEGELSEAQDFDDGIRLAKEKMAEAESSLLKTGIKLTKSRAENTKKLANAIKILVGKLGLENVTLLVELSESAPGPTGMDTVEILFSANKGVQAREIRHVASGGEFSRLIFAVKYLLADKTALPTIIFDEIDTGVSGEVALQMTDMMKTMAVNHQVISISHLPQVAAGGDKHYFVYKDHSSDKSVSRIKELDQSGRAMAIAKMIGGEAPGQSAIASAEELLRDHGPSIQ